MVISKTFWVWNEEKENEFLENKYNEGYRLVSIGFGSYRFEKSEPKKVKFYSDFKIVSKKDEEEYLESFKKSGYELVIKYGSWYYFCKELENDVVFTEDKIYTLKNRREKVSRVITILFAVGLPLYYQLIIFFPNMQGVEFTYPSFYFFFRILVLFFTGLHFLVILKTLSYYNKLKG